MGRWEPRFDFYFSDRGGWPSSTFIDLEARKHAPLPSHPVALQARVRMREPRPDGLRSAEEAPGLFAFEDALAERLASVLDAILVARSVTQGWTDFVFYVPSPRSRRRRRRTSPTTRSPSRGRSMGPLCRALSRRPHQAADDGPPTPRDPRHRAPARREVRRLGATRCSVPVTAQTAVEGCERRSVACSAIASSRSARVSSLRSRPRALVTKMPRARA